MNKSPRRNRVILLVVAAALLVVVALVYLMRRSGPGSGPGQFAGVDPPSGPDAEIELTLLESQYGPRVSNLAHSADRITFTLSVRADEADDAFEEPLVFALPADRTIVPFIESYSYGPEDDRIVIEVENPEPLRAEDGADGEADEEDPKPEVAAANQFRTARSMKIEDLGILRRWRLGVVRFKREFSEKFARASEDSRGELRVDISLRWAEPYEFLDAPPFKAEVDPESSWGRTMGRLVANTEDLGLFQIGLPGSNRTGDDVAQSGDLDTAAPGDTAPISGHGLTAPWDDHPGDRVWARLRLEAEGLYRLGFDDLLFVGFPPDRPLRASDVRVFSHGRPVPLLRRETGGERGTEEILFWHSPSPTEYDTKTVYWVTVDGSMDDPTISPILPVQLEGEIVETERVHRIAHVERDIELKIQTDNLLSFEGLTWVDSVFKTGESIDFNVDLPGYVPDDLPLEASLKFFIAESQARLGASRFDIEVEREDEVISFGTVQPTDPRKGDVEVAFVFQAGSLSPKDNAISLTLPSKAPDNPLGTVETVEPGTPTDLWFDSFEIEYPSLPVLSDGVLDLNEPPMTDLGPVWTAIPAGTEDEFNDAIVLALGPDGRPLGTLELTGRAERLGFHWPGGPRRRTVIRTEAALIDTPRFETVAIDRLTLPDQGADHLIISHADFLDIAADLARLHESQGLRSRVVDVQSVYDHFSNGELSPLAIRDFLAWTLERWTGGAPTYVVLFGDASSDYHNLARNDIINWVPTYTHKFRGDRWASDYWLTLTAGEDDLGDFMIGRISVNNRTDARTIVDKMISYSERPKTGPWRSRLGFIADNGEFPPVVEDLRANHTPPAFETVPIYLNEEMPLQDNWYLPRTYVERERLKVSPVATRSIADLFRNGLSFLTFYGHGSPNIWMDERVWFGGGTPNSDNLFLVDSGHATFVTTMTCNTGAIDYPVHKPSGVNINISEDMLRTRDGGAIALYVPSGPSITQIHQRMSEQLQRTLFGDRLRAFGEIVALTKTRYTLHEHPEQLTMMYLLLGDPAIELQMTSGLREFDLPSPHYFPGQRIRVDLVGLKPAEGQFEAELISASGHSLNDDDAGNFTDGRIALDFTIPSDADLEAARLRVYAWNEKTGEEIAAGSSFEIALPEIQITEARERWNEDGTRDVFVALSNPGSIPITDARLDLLYGASGRSDSSKLLGSNAVMMLGEKEFNLDADAKTTVSLRLNTAALEFIRDAEIRSQDAGMKAPDQPPTEPQPVTLGIAVDPTAGISTLAERPVFATRKSVGLRPASDWVGLVRELCSIEPGPNGTLLQLTGAVLGSPDEDRLWTVGIDDAEGTEVTSKALRLSGGSGLASFNLRGADMDRATSGTLWLATRPAPGDPDGDADADPEVEAGANAETGAESDADTTAQAERISSLSVASLPSLRPRARIVPGSVRVRPESPSDGQTIFVTCDIENVGNKETRAISAALYDKDPGRGGRQLPSEMGNGKARIDTLKPGERREIHLRWDPFNNAGEQEFWIALNSGRSRDASLDTDVKLMHSVRVRSKAALSRGKTWMEPNPDVDGAYLLFGEVLNTGETAAHDVVVIFYRSSLKTEENRLSETILDRVLADQTKVAIVNWVPDPDKDFIPGTEQPEPLHEIRLRGSHQRIAPDNDEKENEDSSANGSENSGAAESSNGTPESN